MLETSVRLDNRLGLHARAAAKLVRLVRSFESSVTLTQPDTERTADAASILELLSLAATLGTRLKITANGPDEAEAIRQIADLFKSKFDEQ